MELCANITINNKMIIEGKVLFLYLPLEIAMKNAHHDEPGYWENLDL